MIKLNVIDCSGASGPYRMTGGAMLILEDGVHCERMKNGLRLIEPTVGWAHNFNKQGEYTGTDRLDVRLPAEVR